MTLLLLAWLAAVRAADPGTVLQVTAGRVVVEDGVARGEGDVRVRLGDAEVSAARFRVALAGGSLVLEEGTLTRPDGVLAFREATLDPEGESGRLLDGRWTPAGGGVSFTASRIEVEDPRHWRLEGASLSPCACPGGGPGPWGVSARRARVDLDGSATFTGGLARVWGCPVLPLPVGVVPLGERRTTLRLPDLAWTPDGAEVGLPVFLVLSPATDLTLEPTWRQVRGLRLAADARTILPDDGRLRLAGTGGWDAREGRARGAARGDLAWASGEARAVVEGEWISDAAWPADYGTRFLDRQVPFREIRTVAGAGPVRFEHDGVQDPAGAPQRIAALVVSDPADGGGSVSAWRRLAVTAVGAEPWIPEGIEVAGGGGVVAGRRLGAVEAEGEAGIEGRTTRDLAGGAPLGLGRLFAGSRATLPLWRAAGAGRTVLAPSLAAQVSAWGITGAVEAPPSVRVGPALEAWRVGPDGVPLRAVLDLAVTDEGFEPVARAWARRGPLAADLAASGAWRPGTAARAGLLAAGTRWDDGVREAGIRAVHLGDVPDLDQVWGLASWALPARGDTWRPGVRVRWSPASGRFVEVAGSLAYHSRCGCLDARLEAAWAEDRDQPDLGLALDLSPARRTAGLAGTGRIPDLRPPPPEPRFLPRQPAP